MKFNVFGMKINVKLSDLRRENIAGFFSPTHNEIQICKSLKKTDKEQTLMHEFLHAVFYRMGIIQSKMPIELEEIIVENFATAITENFSVRPKYSEKPKK
jgi:Zn-dependent peptidase ImmA (M78 family)